MVNLRPWEIPTRSPKATLPMPLLSLTILLPIMPTKATIMAFPDPLHPQARVAPVLNMLLGGLRLLVGVITKDPKYRLGSPFLDLEDHAEMPWPRLLFKLKKNSCLEPLLVEKHHQRPQYTLERHPILTNMNVTWPCGDAEGQKLGGQKSWQYLSINPRSHREKRGRKKKVLAPLFRPCLVLLRIAFSTKSVLVVL